ncbi:MAG TPA: sensor domain-containing diguanylate cyclase, partial [Burkholderiaceae bacterium]
FPKLLDTAALGATGKAQLCFDGRDALACVPPQPGMPLIETPSRTRYGKTLAIAEAMQGRSGLAEMLSTAGVNVVAAYGPVAPGLALAIEQDTAELYTPIRVQFKRMLWILLGLVAGGMLLLRSQLKPLARRLLASETLAADKQQQLATLLHSVGEGILSIRADGAIVSANPAACTIFASTEAEMLTTRLDALIPADMNGGETALSGPLRAALRTTLELRGRRCDGTDFDLELGVEAMPLRGQDLYVAIVRDITQRKEAEQRLTYLARYDSLTGLPNRSLFLDRLGGALTRSKRSGMAMALMYLDLDGFKQINDTLGHQSGDLLLQQFAARLQAAVRESDTVARLAGDEFTIVLENLHDAHANAAAVAAKVLQAMQLPFNLRGGSGSVTASIGTVIYSTGDATLDILLSRADAAMYRAKHQGKNQVVIDMETAGV